MDICVVGAGQMGFGIASTAASFGHKVQLIDSFSASLEKAQTKAASLVEKGTIPLDSIQFLSDVSQIQFCDIVIEAIPEVFDLKQDLFRTLSELLPNTVVFATNTSSFPISSLSNSVVNPERFLGLHFMNPVPVMKLVELIAGPATSNETLQKGVLFLESLQKTVVRSDDRPGFIVNRLLIPMINQAIIALSEKLASVEDIDAAMMLGASHPMGPLRLADFIGLDTCLSILKTLHQGFPGAGYAPSPLLEQYVAKGWLGKKAGIGFYKYP